MAKKRQRRLTLGKISVNLRLKPKTKDELWRLAGLNHTTASDYVEAVLLSHFKETISEAKPSGA